MDQLLPSNANIFNTSPRSRKINLYNEVINPMLSTIEKLVGNFRKIPRESLAGIQATTHYFSRVVSSIMEKWEKIMRLGVEPVKIFQVINSIYGSLRTSKVVLHNIEISVENDLELPSWEYVVIRLYVDGDFDEIDRFWTKISYDAHRILGDQAKRVFILVE